MIAPARGGGGKSELSRAECLVTRGPARVHPAFGWIHPEGTESATEKRPPRVPPKAGSRGKGEKVV